MATRTTTPLAEAQLIAELNDLLQLDHDAVQAYNLAIGNLKNESYRATVQRFRGDHERHIENLGTLVREYGGIPLEIPHIPSGAFKMAVQAAGAAGGDKGLLLAFKANERQVRDKYRRMAERAQPDNVRTVLQGNAADEQRHYSWALETLEDLGLGPESTAGKMEQALERGHGKLADVTESMERKGMVAMEETRRGATRQLKEHPVRTALIAAGAALVVAGMMRQQDRR